MIISASNIFYKREIQNNVNALKKQKPTNLIDYNKSNQHSHLKIALQFLTSDNLMLNSAG